jgi:hypothetical protein
VVLAYLLSRRCLVGGEAPSSSAGGAPDCCQNRRNWRVRFTKSEGIIFPVSSRSFLLLFVSCVNRVLDSLSSEHSRQMGHPAASVQHRLSRIPVPLFRSIASSFLYPSLILSTQTESGRWCLYRNHLHQIIIFDQIR